MRILLLILRMLKERLLMAAGEEVIRKKLGGSNDAESRCDNADNSDADADNSDADADHNTHSLVKLSKTICKSR